MRFRGLGSGEGEERRLVGTGLKLHFMPLSPCKPQGKNKTKKKKQSVLTLCYTALESQLLFLLKKSLWTSNKKNSYCGFKVSLWQTVVGRLRSKPGAPVATAVGKELLGHGELPLGLNGVFRRTTAWLQGTESQVGRGLSPLLPDCLLFLRMGQKL